MRKAKHLKRDHGRLRLQTYFNVWNLPRSTRELAHTERILAAMKHAAQKAMLEMLTKHYGYPEDTELLTGGDEAKVFWDDNYAPPTSLSKEDDADAS